MGKQSKDKKEIYIPSNNDFHTAFDGVEIIVRNHTAKITVIKSIKRGISIRTRRRLP